MLSGNITDLRTNVVKKLKKFGDKRMPVTSIVSSDIASRMVEVSIETSRQVGIIVERNGLISHVIVGDSNEIMIPYLGRYSLSRGSFRGVRLVHTHFRGQSLTQDDLSDLALLRLDSVSVVHFLDDGRLTNLETAYLLPLSAEDVNVASSGELFSSSSVRDLYRIEKMNFYEAERTIDYVEVITSLEDECKERAGNILDVKKEANAILVGVYKDRESAEESLFELHSLASSAGVNVINAIYQIRSSIDGRYVVGAGKLKEIVISAMHYGADCIIFDNQLSPAQSRSVTEFTDLKILDRVQIILDIFARRAHSNEGKIRVELAQLTYILPYLTGKGTSLSRLAGGIGGRGPGETKLEIDRRRIGERIVLLGEKLKKIERNRNEGKKRRNINNVPTISIIGYTNAGKTTLLNSLTNANAYADDLMFATLDTVSKRLRFPEDREVIIVDTVGFIKDLPPNLVGAFRSTLEEVSDADMFLHLVDASSSYYEQKIEAVRGVFRGLGVDEKLELLVFNKVDALSEESLELLRLTYPNAVFVSAKDRASLRVMLVRIEEMLFFSRLL